MTFSYLTTTATTRFSFFFWLLLCIVASMGLGQLKFAVDYTSYFSEDDQRFNRFRTFQRDFAQDDQLVIIIESKQDNNIKKHLPFIKDLTSALSDLSFIKKVGGFKESYFNPLSSALPVGGKQNPALTEFVATDNSAVLLTLSFNQHDAVSDFLTQLNSARDLINRQMTQYDPKLEVYYSGELALNWQYAEVLKHDLIWFLPGLILLLCIMLWLVIPEKWWIVGIASSSFVVLICTLGLAAWGHFTIAAISAFVPVIIIVLNVAYAMHLYFDWRNAYANIYGNTSSDSVLNCDPKQAALTALITSMKRNFKPLFWGSITTAFGFILLRFSPSPPIQDFGAMVAFAVLISFLVNYSVLITFARLAHYKVISIINLSHFCGHLYRLGWYYRRAVLIIVGTLTLLAAISLSQLRFDDDAANYFPTDNVFSVSKQVMETKFNGINNINFVVDTNTELGITESSYIKKINQFSRFLTKQDEVIKVHSIVDWLKWYGVGQHQFKQILTGNTIQTLGIERLVNVDSSASLLRVNLVPMKASELIDFEDKVLSYLTSNNLHTLISPPLSQQLVFAHLSRENSWTMLSSFIAALLLLLTLLIFLKRSFKLALLGLLANMLPLVLVFGFWQFIGGSLSLGCAVVMGMILGIIIDDSLHLLLKVSESESSEIDSTLNGFREVMPAITFTSILLVLGFSLGLNSDFFPIIELSFLSLLTIFIAWLFDFIVLPVCYRLAMRGER
ncbi:MMPL family transporter [Psychromonas arctica]|uniref:MMPL family transporter n=1 Tax=Psychromonas arctica TaxID=168275 RepID=A0ABU9H8Q5_9GAMM